MSALDRRCFYDVLAFFADADDLFLERVWSHSPEAAIAQVLRYRAGDLPDNRLGLLAREEKPAKRAKRDEFSCPCCGTSTDSSYCAPCAAAECGECDVRNPDGMLCVAHLPAGWLFVGTCFERVELKGGAIELCKVELLRDASGERQFGRIREVLS